MNKITILNVNYEVLESIEGINIADSFVMPQNKIGEGNGEAKLYIGQRGKELRQFWGEDGFSVPCFMVKENLVRYINETRQEHIAPTQEYRKKDTLASIWDNKLQKILSSAEIIEFIVQDQNQLLGPRVYVNSSSQGYQLIRELCLPVISHIDIFKLKNLDNQNILYYFYIYSDFVNTVLEEDEALSPDDSEFEPFNPELISIDTKKITMDTLIRRLNQKTINLSPDFQRNYVWTIEKKSQLIESLMLKIPLPMFYVSSDEKGNYTVVDGLQRLSTLRDYLIDHKFKLQKLEFWGDQLNNCGFNELPEYLQNRIFETEFTFTVINQGTPDIVKRNIFKRVNRGGAPLTDQEIRHALYSGSSTDLLKILAQEESFLRATNYSIKAERMLDRELILRLLSFMIRNYSAYPKNGNMDLFLCDTLKIMNSMPNLNSKEVIQISNNISSEVKYHDINEIKRKFCEAMNRASTIFGEHTFRKSYYGQRKSPVNKSLFEVWGTLLSELSEDEFIILKKNKRKFLMTYRESFLTNYDFDEIISRNALKYNSVVERYTKLNQLLKAHII